MVGSRARGLCGAHDLPLERPPVGLPRVYCHVQITPLVPPSAYTRPVECVTLATGIHPRN